MDTSECITATSSHVTLTCQCCDLPFQRLRGEVNRTRKAKSGPFCSRACRNSYLCKGKTYSEARKQRLKGRIPWNKGKAWSPEMREHLREKALGGAHGKERNGNWRGGRRMTDKGYIEIRVDGKPKLEHRDVMEKALGRLLDPTELVHHKNGDKADNRLDNLEILTPTAHMKQHNPDGPPRRERSIPCRFCGTIIITRSTEDATRMVCTSKVCKRQQALESERAYRARKKARKEAEASHA